MLDAHAKVAAHLTLPRAEAKKLVRWLFKFRFERQDFFEVDIDRYASTVGEEGVEQYRTLVDAAAEMDPESSAVGYARGRLAILARDADEIIGHFGRDLSRTYYYVALVEALDEAGHGDLAGRL